jgi:ribonuclease PH
MRIDARKQDELRPIKITPGYLHHPTGSVLIECGLTRVICSATVADEVPPWMRAQKIKGGWITAEYQLLPTSTHERVKRERKGVSGRTQEIQRLIGRSLRASCDLSKLEGKTIYIDCDVLDADGGTRCASISGAMVALRIAINKLLVNGSIKEDPIINNIAAVSVGVIDDTAILDLCYSEDCGAEVDMNIIMTDKNEFVEIQGTAEWKTFTRNKMNEMLDIAEKGINNIFKVQEDVI